jgi:hypothetical protein
MMTITEFCDRHCACPDGREWALANCTTMQEAWDTARPEWVVWIATRPGVLDDRTLRKFAVWSPRQVQHLMTDPRSTHALDVADRHADGLATDEELAAARDAAWAAAWAAARVTALDVAQAARAAARAAWAAAQAAARDAALDVAQDARDAAWAAALAAAVAAARDAARDAQAAAGAAALDVAQDARDAAGDAAWAAARVAQAAWLRANAKPNWEATR